LLGLDHLLAMIAVGLGRRRQGGRALRAVPAAFVAAMGLGARGMDGGVLRRSSRHRQSCWPGLLIAAAPLSCRRLWRQAPVFALFHGYAHGLEMPQAASPVPYALGFVLATVFLHGAGIAGSLAGRRAVQAAGAGIATAGLALIFAM